MFLATARSRDSLSVRILLVALTIVTASHIATVFYTRSALRALLPPEHEYTYIGDDYPAQLPIKLPPAGLVLTTGRPHYSLLADDDWGTLFPPGGNGFVDIGPTNRTFSVSMVHQLHCLDVIRVSFVTNRTGAYEHVEHCLRYMRQTVLCHADTTLEADEPMRVNGVWEHAADGLGSVHRCRDWTVLRDFMDAHPPGEVKMSERIEAEA